MAFAGARLPVGVEGAYTDSVGERLQREMEVFVGFQLHHHDTPVAVEREQVKHASVAAGKRRTCE